MIRSELIANLCADFPGQRGDDIEGAVGIFFNTIIDQLGEGGRVELRGFGAFSVRDYSERTGRNPRTGEAVAVAGKSRVHFKAGKGITDRLNHKI
ncbi:integration host factor subunit beta [Sphingobium naphthae]|nr:integration host factor subunit beta [Sphingobium naphthae]